MMAGVITHHAAHIQQMKLIAAGQYRRYIAHKAFQRATPSEHSDQQIARIDLRKPARRQLEHVVGGTVSERADDDHIARLRRV